MEEVVEAADGDQNPLLTCSACFDDIDDSEDQRIFVDDSPLCRDCLAQIFELSVTYESAFPPRWGASILNPRDYLRYRAFNTLFLTEFERKESEFSCPTKERIYCAYQPSSDGAESCDVYISRLSAEKSYVQCWKCKHYTCCKCRALVSTAPLGSESPSFEKEALDKHCHPTCIKKAVAGNPSTADTDDELETAFAGLVRGKDYQICPNPRCSIRIELAAACNHISCGSCRTEFCFICGRRVMERRGHWLRGSQGGCPLYGQPTSERAIYGEPNLGVVLQEEVNAEEAHQDELLNWQLNQLNIGEIPAALLGVLPRLRGPSDDRNRLAQGQPGAQRSPAQELLDREWRSMADFIRLRVPGRRHGHRNGRRVNGRLQPTPEHWDEYTRFWLSYGGLPGDTPPFTSPADTIRRRDMANPNWRGEHGALQERSTANTNPLFGNIEDWLESQGALRPAPQVSGRDFAKRGKGKKMEETAPGMQGSASNMGPAESGFPAVKRSRRKSALARVTQLFRGHSEVG